MDWQQCLDRQKNIILLEDEHFRLLLIYWPPYKRSSKHGHPKGGGLIRLLSGRLLETRFDTLAPECIIGKYLYQAGAMSYIHDSVALHTVENPSEVPAVSLHLYGVGRSAQKVVDNKAA